MMIGFMRLAISRLTVAIVTVSSTMIKSIILRARCPVQKERSKINHLLLRSVSIVVEAV